MHCQSTAKVLTTQALTVNACKHNVLYFHCLMQQCNNQATTKQQPSNVLSMHCQCTVTKHNASKHLLSMHNAQCTMRNAQCTMHNAQCTMHNAQCTIHNAQYTMHQTTHCRACKQPLSMLHQPSINQALPMYSLTTQARTVQCTVNAMSIALPMHCQCTANVLTNHAKHLLCNALSNALTNVLTNKCKALTVNAQCTLHNALSKLHQPSTYCAMHCQLH